MNNFTMADNQAVDDVVIEASHESEQDIVQALTPLLILGCKDPMVFMTIVLVGPGLVLILLLLLTLILLLPTGDFRKLMPADRKPIRTLMIMTAAQAQA